MPIDKPVNHYKNVSPRAPGDPTTLCGEGHYDSPKMNGLPCHGCEYTRRVDVEAELRRREEEIEGLKAQLDAMAKLRDGYGDDGVAKSLQEANDRAEDAEKDRDEWKRIAEGQARDAKAAVKRVGELERVIRVATFAPSGAVLCCCKNSNAVKSGMEKACWYCEARRALERADEGGGQDGEAQKKRRRPAG